MNRKIVRIALWFVGLVSLSLLFGFVNNRRNQSVCKGVEVIMEGDSSLHFIGEDEIVDLIREKGGPFEGKLINQVNTHKAETALLAHPAIETADVFFTMDGMLKARVRQREPLLRVFDLMGDSYYIDKNGKYMPTLESFTALVPVANGFITDLWPKYTVNISELLQNDSIEQAAIVDDLFAIADAIQKDTLLSAQLLQLHVRADRNIEMIARVGPEVVLIGDKSNLGPKLRNLKLFYSRSVQEPASASYSSINLKYHNQIICTKSTQ